MATALYIAMTEAQARFDANVLSREALRAVEAAEALYNAVLAAKRKDWNAIPASRRKSDAEENADQTEGCEVDRLQWYQIAISSYELA